MRPFRNLPIRRKLALAMMLTSGAALVIATVSITLFGVFETRNSTIQRATSWADIIASHSQSMMVAGRTDAAEAELRTFKDQSRVLTVWLLRPDGGVFARYTRDPADANLPPPAPEADCHRFEGNRLTVFRAVRTDNRQRVGTICLLFDASDLYTRTLKYAGLIIFMLLASLCASWVVSRRSQRTISTPILELARVARNVTEQKDYSLRAPEHDGDEVGQLVGSFNQMLATIEEQQKTLQATSDSRSRRHDEMQQELKRRLEAEQKLKTAYDDVERKVRERTAELQKANDALRAEIALREQATAALNSADARFRALIENSSEVIVLVSPEAVIKYVSPTVGRVLGYTPEEILGSDAFQWVHLEDQARLRRDLGGLLQDSNRLISDRYRLRHRDGSWRWVESLGENMLAEPGVQAVVVNLRDVTARVEAETKMHRMEARFRAMIENSSDGVTMINAAGTHIYVSPATQRMLGYSEEEILGHNGFEMMHPDDVPRIQQVFTEALKGQQDVARMEYRYRHKDGSWRWCEAVGVNRLADPHVQAIIINSRDITERKEAEEALERSERIHRAAIEAGGAVPYTLDHRTQHFGFMGAGIEAMTGYAPHECTPELWENVIEVVIMPDGETFRKLSEATRKFQAGSGTAWSAEYRVRRRDGRECWMNDAGVDERDANGKIVRSIGMLLDITERKRAEETLHHRLALEHLVASVSSRLANTAASEVDAAIQETLAKLGENTRTDRCFLFQVTDNLDIAANTHEWCAPGVRSQLDELRNIPTSAFPWLLERLRRGEPLVLPCPAELPAEAEAERRLLQAGDVQSALLVPLRQAGRLVGLIGCDSVRAGRIWPDDDIQMVRTVGEACANALARRQAEMVLRESERKYRGLHETMTDAFVRVNMDGRIQESNRAYREMLGYTEEELLAFTYRDLTPAKWHEYQDVIIREQVIPRGYSDVYQKEYRHKDGTVFPIELRTILIRDDQGAPAGMWALMRDITERKRAEEAIHKSHALLQAVIENTGDSVFAYDLQDHFMLANRTLASALGLPVERIVGKHISDFFGPADCETLATQNRAARVSEQPQTFEDTVILGNARHTFLTSKTQLRGNQGEVIGVVGVAHDITERKRMEEILRASEERYRTLAEAAHDIIFMVDRDDRVRYVNSFAARMTGKSPEELVGRLRGDLFPTTAGERQRKNLERVFISGHALYVEDSFPTALGELMIGTWLTPVRAPDGSVEAVLGISRDITERMQAEQAMHESYTLLRNVIESTSDPVYVKDSQGHYVIANSALATAYGKPADEIIGKTPAQLVPPEAAAQMDAEDRAVIADNCPRTFEESFTLNDGVPRYYLNAKTPLRDERGSVIGIVGVAHEITGRKRMEEVLRESEAKYKSLIETTDTGYVIVNTEGRVTDANPEYVRLSGHQRLEEILGRSVTEWTAPHDRERNAEAVKKCAEQGYIRNLELDYVNKEGRFTPLEINATVITTLGVTHIVSLCRDITERKQAAAALRESETRFRAVLTTSLDVIHRRNLQANHYDFISPAIETLTGVPAAELLGKGVETAMEGIHPNDLPAVKQFLERVETGEVTNGSLEYRLRHKDGSYRWVADRLTVIKDDAARPLYLVGVARDITEQVHLQDALMRSEQMHRASVEAAGAVPYARDFTANRFEFIGTGIKALTGYGPAEFTPDIWHRIIQEGVPTGEFAGMKHEAAMKRFHEQRLTAWTCDYRLRCREGNDRWVACSAVDVRDAEGRSVRSIGMLHDITPRKHGEEALREAHNLLEQRVIERTAELQQEVAERQHAETALRQLSGRLLQIQDEERRRMARELHDSTAQTIAAISINLSLIHKQAAKLAPDARRALGDSLTLANQCSQEIRTMSYLLHPPLLDEFGLVTTLRWYADGFAQRSGVRIELDLPPKSERLPRETETTLFRVAQEALANIHRHSGSQMARIQLAVTEHEVTLRVQDEGRGMASSSPDDSKARIGRLGVGISGMRERVRQLGGHLDIQSGKHGTTISVTIPLTKATS